MSRVFWTIAVVGLIAGVIWIGWSAVRKVYLEPKADLEDRIVKTTSNLKRYRDQSADWSAVRAATEQYVDRTLGGDRETVDHELRTRLNRIGADLGLEGLSVGTGRLRSLESPAKSAFSRRTYRQLREEIDFVEVEAWISGQGSLEQVLRLIHRLHAQPWLKRVGQVRLQSRDKGKRFAVTVRLTTLFLPDRAPARPLAAPDNPPGFERYLSLTQRNPFVVPVKAPPPERAAKAVAAKPLANWLLTGVVSGPAGVEIWLLNQKTGTSRRLAVGDRLRDAVLVAANGEVAEFRRGNQLFQVLVGHPLLN